VLGCSPLRPPPFLDELENLAAVQAEIHAGDVERGGGDDLGLDEEDLTIPTSDPDAAIASRLFEQ